MAAVTVFVDDAVRGRFPPVCAATGAPASRLVRVDSQVGGPSPLVWLLLLAGPPGWVLLVVLLACCRTESLSVSVPYSDEVLARARRVRRVRWVSALVAVCAAAVAVSGWLLLVSVWLTLALAAAMVAVVAHGVLVFDGVSTQLDASRRWVTIGGVHADFANAVRARSVDARR